MYFSFLFLHFLFFPTTAYSCATASDNTALFHLFKVRVQEEAQSPSHVIVSIDIGLYSYYTASSRSTVPAAQHALGTLVKRKW